MEFDFRLGGFFDQLLHVVRAERRVPAEKNVGDDSCRPHIDRLAVAALVEDLRGDISKATRQRGELLLRGVKVLRAV